MNDIVKIGSDEKFCSTCGNVIRAKAEICPKCGVRQLPAPINGKNRIVAALLAFCLGGIGVHKFYLGQIVWGFIYLIFCWTFIPSIVSFVEFIILLCTSDETFNARFNKQQ